MKGIIMDEKENRFNNLDNCDCKRRRSSGRRLGVITEKLNISLVLNAVLIGMVALLLVVSMGTLHLFKMSNIRERDYQAAIAQLLEYQINQGAASNPTPLYTQDGSSGSSMPSGCSAMGYPNGMICQLADGSISSSQGSMMGNGTTMSNGTGSTTSDDGTISYPMSGGMTNQNQINPNITCSNCQEIGSIQSGGLSRIR